MNPAEPTWLGLATIILTILVHAAASAFLAALIVEDDVTDPIRQWIWGPPERPRFPYKGRGLPLDLDGGRSAMSPGTYLGELLLCVRCVGVYTSTLVVVATWAVTSVPGRGLGQHVVFGAIQLFATCQVQRRFNLLTHRSPSR